MTNETICAEPGRKIGAIYVRTSKEKADGFSLSAQIKICRRYGDDHNILVPDDYIFREDFSGRHFDRPEYSKLRPLIQARAIIYVIVAATDRLARKVSVGEIYFDEMCQHGVALIISPWGQPVKDTPEDRLRLQFEMSFSSYEREKIVQRTRDGKIQKAEEGKIIAHSRPLYGV